jgi:hypothetical protein
MKCTACEDVGWVCENHLNRVWDGPHGCGGAGVRCPACKSDIAEAEVQRMENGSPRMGLPSR